MKVLSIAVVVVACAVVANALPLARKADITQALIQSLGREESYKLALIQTISELLEQKEQAEIQWNQGGFEHPSKLWQGNALQEERVEIQWGQGGFEHPAKLRQDIVPQEEQAEIQGGLEHLVKLWEDIEAQEEQAEIQWGNQGQGGLEDPARLWKDEAQEKQAEIQWGNQDQGGLEDPARLWEDDEAEEEQALIQSGVEDGKAKDIEAQENKKEMSIQDILELIGKLQKEKQATKWDDDGK